MRFIVAVLAGCLVGCVPVGRNAHLVLGLGVFRVGQTNQVTVVKASTLGVHLGDHRMNVGVSTVTVVDIPTNSNTILELKDR
jgi:hypothetical protein